MRNASGKYTFVFVVILCFATALILSAVSLLLSPTQEKAEKIYKYKQLLKAANIKTLNVLETYKARVHTYYTNAFGSLTESPTDLPVFVITEPGSKEIESYVFPIKGFGLWDALYGYLSVDKNGDTVIGTTWYDQKETPGLGGEIATEKWQKQFYGKKIFQQNPDGTTSYTTAPLGIRVIKGQSVRPYEKPSTVDGISGATITSEGVAEAYRTSLAPYRPFLIRAHKGEVTLD